MELKGVNKNTKAENFIVFKIYIPLQYKKKIISQSLKLNHLTTNK